MNKNEMEIAEKTYDTVVRFKNELLDLCDGQSISMTIAVLLASADELIDTAKEIGEITTKRKNVWDLIKETLEETQK